MKQRYFFDVTNGHRLADPTGLECGSDREAIAFADFVAGQIPAEMPSAGGRWVTVRDSEGHELGKVSVDVRCGQEAEMAANKMPLPRSSLFCTIPFLVVLSGCDARPECDSIETRGAVLKTVSDDHHNPLLDYAAKNSTAMPNLENTKPLYLLGERMVTTSKSQDKRTLQCSGAISVSVGDIKASKEVNFTVQQAADGKLSVSVAPFQF